MRADQLEPVRALTGGGGAASVTLVRAQGREWVLKRHRPRDVAAERRFHQTLRAHGLPALLTPDCEGLQPGEIVLEYVAGSPTLGAAPLTPELCGRWGQAIGALHRIETDGLVQLDAAGEPQPSTWPDFARGLIRRTLERQRRLVADGVSDLPPALLDAAEARLAPLAETFVPARFVLTHGDLHLNNALARGEAIVLFDKPADVWSAPALFDVCLMLSETFPAVRYGAADPSRLHDPERLAAFLEGYGPLPPAETPWLEPLVLLRSLRRYPNPFVPEMRSIIETALARLG